MAPLFYFTAIQMEIANRIQNAALPVKTEIHAFERVLFFIFVFLLIVFF